MAGLIPPTSGPISAVSIPVLLGVSAAMRPNLTGWGNIFLGSLALELKRCEIASQIEDVIEFSGMRDSIDHPFRTYSSGMKARCNLPCRHRFVQKSCCG